MRVSRPPLERIVFAGAHATVGEWRCDRGRPDFADTGPIEHHLVAFARTSVRIRHEGGRPFVADATVFSLYNRDQRYTREAVHPLGDHCDWWGVDADTARAIAAHVDPHPRHESGRPFRFQCGPADTELFLDQRRLLERLRVGEVDALEAEEAAMSIVARALGAARGAASRVPASRPAHRDIAQATLAFVGARPCQRLTLSTISGALEVTSFHLCRVFHAETGMPLHRYVTRLRLCAVLDDVAQPDADLCRVGLDAGFCSHSHFTSAFRRELGVTPSAWRARIRGGHRSGRNSSSRWRRRRPTTR
jgi:AraC-like DNA-binding protein